MKVLVAVKRVVDYNVKVHPRADGEDVELTGLKMSINPFDEIAVEAAVQLKEAGKASEVVAVSIGPEKTTDILRVAMAIGADRSRAFGAYDRAFYCGQNFGSDRASGSTRFGFNR